MKCLMHLIVILLFSTTFSSCEVDINKRIEGVWVIDNMTYLNQPCMDAFLVNMIDFEKKDVIIPTRRGYHNYRGIDTAYWTAKKVEGVFEMKIKSIDPVFNRTFIITYDHPNKYKNPTMILSSDSVKIYCTKTPTFL